MKKTLPLLAVTALSAELFLARTARAEAVTPSSEPLTQAGVASVSVSLVSAIGTAVSSLTGRLCHAAITAPKPPPGPPTPPPRPPSGNGKRSCYDDEASSC
jgi:hypothetical protein